MKNSTCNLTIEGESRSQILKDQSLTIEGALQQKVGTVAVLEAGKEFHLTSGDHTIIEAGADITLQAGGSFIKIDASGVHIVGSAINLNSFFSPGGSPGSGSGFSGLLPTLPTVSAELKEAEEPVAAEESAPEEEPTEEAAEEEPAEEAAEEEPAEAPTAIPFNFSG